MLSDRQIKALKGQGKDVMLSDGGGLYVRVSIHGSKTFIYRTREGGKARYQTVGEYPRLTLAQAREKAGQLQGNKLGDVTLSFAITQYLDQLDYLHPAQVKQRLDKDIIPPLGAKRLSTIATKDLTDALDKIVQRGSLVAANRTLADVKHIFAYSFEKGWIAKDPSEKITRRVVGGKEKSKKIVLTDAELKELIADLRSDRWEIKTRVGIALVLITGQRSSECLGSKDEVEGNWWTIPSHRTNKTDLPPQKVYLVPLARYLTRYVEPCDHRTLSKALLRANRRYTPHSLRHTMRTKMGDLGVMPHVAEKCLHHKLEGVLAVYDHGEYLPERETAWKLWYAYLRRLL